MRQKQNLLLQISGANSSSCLPIKAKAFILIFLIIFLIFAMSRFSAALKPEYGSTLKIDNELIKSICN